MTYAHRVGQGSTVSLGDIDPDSRGGLSRKEGEERTDELLEELDGLQEEMYAAGQSALLVVFQGLDTSGKDGAIRRVIGALNPVGCRVTSFKVPTPLEASHDFLWRVHRETPARGTVGAFNRSHYEDVLTARVHGVVPREVWEARYEAIAQFEHLLASTGTIVVKLMLHISKKEQKKRLLAREERPAKAWKVAVGDWQERQRWDDYQAAYEDVLSRCSTDEAPWYVVPSDHKWFRNLAIAQVLVETLRPYHGRWCEAIDRMRAERLADLERARAEGKI
jgi:PPK2 family polyphosphate:nucleotide phosphotransferase